MLYSAQQLREITHTKNHFSRKLLKKEHAVKSVRLFLMLRNECKPILFLPLSITRNGLHVPCVKKNLTLFTACSLNQITYQSVIWHWNCTIYCKYIYIRCVFNLSEKKTLWWRDLEKLVTPTDEKIMKFHYDKTQQD